MTSHVTSTPRPRRSANGAAFDASVVLRWVRGCAEDIATHRDFLTQLDAAIGDADHGVNMDRGFSAAISVLDAEPDLGPGGLLTQLGATLMLRVGGASGPLYGTAFREMGSALGDRPRFGLAELADAFDAGLAAIVALGAAEEGDKTMVDAWVPAIAAIRNGRRSAVTETLQEAKHAAEAGAVATIPMTARKGRASYLGPRSVGHQDPGATSSAIVFAALSRSVG